MTATQSYDEHRAASPGVDGVYYLYGIVPAGTAVPDDVLGVDDRAAELVEHGDLAVVVGVVAADRPLGRRADLLAHSRVLDAVADQAAVIPVRFGSVLGDPDEIVTELLAPNAERLTAVLDDLSGRSQFTLRARYDEEVVLTELVSENPDIAHLREQTRDQPEEATYAARMRLGELVAHALDDKRVVDGEALLDLVVPYAAAYHVREGSGLDHLIDVAFLVDTDRRDDFEAAAEEAAAVLHERARVKLLGPSAPYDFVPEE